MRTETALRRRAHHHGLTLIKFRENSSWHNQNWPYAVRTGCTDHLDGLGGVAARMALSAAVIDGYSVKSAQVLQICSEHHVSAGGVV